MVVPMATTVASQIGSAEACALLGINRSTLVRMVKGDRLTPAMKLPGASGAYVFDRADVEAHAAERAR